MKRLSRRKLLTGGAVAGMLTVGGLAFASEARRGGRLRIAVSDGRSSDSWDSRYFDSLFMMAAGQGCVFDCLTEVAADGTLRGELAEHWDVTPDARIWTFTLRRGVVFHNGASFGARDVLASFERHRTGSLATPLLDPIKDIRLLSDHQVQFVLRESNADFPYILSDYRLIIHPADNIQTALRDGIGTGLYQVDRFHPGKVLITRRVGEHYKDGQAGWVERVEFHTVPDAADRLQGLMQGAFDAADVPHGLPVKAASDLCLQSVLGNAHLAHDLTGLDAHLRGALRHGLNRDHLAQKNAAIVGADSPFGPLNTAFDPAAGHSLFDADKAKYHLARADQTTIAPLFGVNTQALDELAGLRIDDQANPVPSRYWFGRATEDWMLSARAAHQPLSPSLATLQRQARAEMDSTRRAALYAELDAVMGQGDDTLIPAFTPFVQATRPSVGMPQTLGNLAPLDNARLAERWWRA